MLEHAFNWNAERTELREWLHDQGGVPECLLFGGKNTVQKRFGTYDSVRCPEFRGGHFSEVANVLQASGFQSVTRTLSALGSVSVSRSVRSGRFDCIMCSIHTCTVQYIHVQFISMLLAPE